MIRWAFSRYVGCHSRQGIHTGTSILYNEHESVSGDEGMRLSKTLADEKMGKFRTLDIGKPGPLTGKTRSRSKFRKTNYPRREKKMRPDQDWPSVWPAARTFHPASVPLPIRQGFTQTSDQVVPGKYANAELMKIPNFLHLTPPAIKRQCDALKRFCTAWPEGLADADTLDVHFPVTEISSDYLNASSSVRDARSRIVTHRFRLSALRLDMASRDKFIRLVGTERYDVETDVVTLSADRCPYRKQNRDYCRYLVKALYYESSKREEWEALAGECDKAEYEFDAAGGAGSELPVRSAASKILNEGEDPRTLADYKAAVLGLLNVADGLPVGASEVSCP